MSKSLIQQLVVLVVWLLVAMPARPATTVFVNVNVVPMNDPVVLTEQTVVIENGRVARLGSVDVVPVPDGAVVVDGTDRFLIPGLGEMHAHVTGVANFDRLATLFVANGVTTIRGMLGQSAHLQLQEQLRSGEVFGPRFITSGPSLNGRSVAGVADAARQVRAQHAAGYDFVKVHPGLRADEFHSLATTANEIGMPYAGHVPVATGVRQALQLGMSTIDHLDGYFVAMLPANVDGGGGFGGFFDFMLVDKIDTGQIPAIAAETAAAGTWNVPTQVLIEQRIDALSVETMKARPEMRFVPDATLNSWVETKQELLDDRDFEPAVAARAIAARRRLILELHKAGAGLLLGSDAPQVFNVPGFSLHRELEVLVAAGLTPFEALQTGTTAIAEFLDSNTGAIAEGSEADLILLDANPLQDIRNTHRIHGVMLRGVWLSRSELDARLAQYIVR